MTGVPGLVAGLPYFSGEPARYLRSLLLHQAGRDEESLRLLEVAFTGTPNELHYRAPTHLLRATIYQRLDQRPPSSTPDSSKCGMAVIRRCDLWPTVPGPSWPH
jgi:hypothetical protein